MATLDAVLEDGTLLLDRYVTKAPNYLSFDFRTAKETDVYHSSPHGLATVEILNPLTRVSVQGNNLHHIGQEKLLLVKTAKNTGYVRPSCVSAPDSPRRLESRLDRLGDTLRNLQHPILLKVGSYQYTDAYDAKGVSHGKAQMLVLDPQSRPLLWIGIRHWDEDYLKINERSSMNVLRHREVRAFMADLTTLMTEIPSTFWRPVKDGQLAAMAMFGPDFGGKPGPDNVDLIGQGDLRLLAEDEGDTYQLSFPRMWVSPDLSKIGGNFSPVLVAKPGNVQGFRFNGANYKADLAVVPFICVGRKDNLQI